MPKTVNFQAALASAAKTGKVAETAEAGGDEHGPDDLPETLVDFDWRDCAVERDPDQIPSEVSSPSIDVAQDSESTRQENWGGLPVRDVDGQGVWGMRQRPVVSASTNKRKRPIERKPSADDYPQSLGGHRPGISALTNSRKLPVERKPSAEDAPRSLVSSPRSSSPENEPLRCHLHKKRKEGCKFCQRYRVQPDNVSVNPPSAKTQRLSSEPSDNNAWALEVVDKKTFGLGSVLKNHIISSRKYQALRSMQTFDELVDEVVNSADTVNAYIGEHGSTPSPLFCILFRLCELGMDGGRLWTLVDSVRNPFIRCIGFLFVRFALSPDKLCSWLVDYINDDEKFWPSMSSQFQTSIGQFVEDLLTQEKYGKLSLPRIPVTIIRQLEPQLAIASQYRKRIRANRELLHIYRQEGIHVQICLDGEWCPATTTGLGEDARFRPEVSVQLEAGLEKEGAVAHNVHLGQIILASRPRATIPVPPPPPASRFSSAPAQTPLVGVPPPPHPPRPPLPPPPPPPVRKPSKEEPLLAQGSTSEQDPIEDGQPMRSRSPKNIDWAREKGPSLAWLLEDMQNRGRERAVCSTSARKYYAQKPQVFQAAMPREMGSAFKKTLTEDLSSGHAPRYTQQQEHDEMAEPTTSQSCQEAEIRRQQIIEKYCPAQKPSTGARQKPDIDTPDIIRLG